MSPFAALSGYVDCIHASSDGTGSHLYCLLSLSHWLGSTSPSWVLLLSCGYSSLMVLMLAMMLLVPHKSLLAFNSRLHMNSNWMSHDTTQDIGTMFIIAAMTLSYTDMAVFSIQTSCILKRSSAACSTTQQCDCIYDGRDANGSRYFYFVFFLEYTDCIFTTPNDFQHSTKQQRLCRLLSLAGWTTVRFNIIMDSSSNTCDIAIVLMMMATIVLTNSTVPSSLLAHLFIAQLEAVMALTHIVTTPLVFGLLNLSSWDTTCGDDIDTLLLLFSTDTLNVFLQWISDT